MTRTEQVTTSQGTDDLNALFGRDALYMGLWAVQIVAAAAVTPVLTRMLPIGEFGLLAGVNAVMQVVFILAGAGLATEIQRKHAGGDLGYAQRLVGLTALLSVVVCGLAHLTGPLWAPALGFPGYGIALVLSLGWAGTSAVTASQLALLRSQDRLVMFAVVSLLQSLVAELLSLAFVATTGEGAPAFVLGQLLAQVAAVSLGAFALGTRAPRLAERRALLASLAFSLPLVPAALSSFVLGVSDRLVVQSLLGATAVARYQVAYNIGSLPMILVGVLATAWLPRFFAASGERTALLVAARDGLDVVLAPVVFGLCVGAPLVLTLWVPPSYDRQGLLLPVALVVISVYPVAASLSWTRILLPAGRSHAVAYGNVGAAVINVLLNLVLVPVAGLEGAALATVISYVLLAAFLFAAGRRVRSMPRRSARVLLLTWGAVIAALVSAGAPTSGTWLAGRVVLGGAAFVAMCWTLRRFHKR